MRREQPQRVSAAARDEQLAAVVGVLAAQAQALRTGDEWAAVLRRAALLPGHSFANVLLITAQCPRATMVAGYEAWLALGRQVTRDQKGIAILAGTSPATTGGPTAASIFAGEPGPASGTGRIRLTYVWDVTQTTGSPVPAQTRHETPMELPDALAWAARREGFVIEHEYCAGADALTMWTGRRIRVRPGLPGAQEAMAVLHQLAHITLHSHLPEPPCATAAGCDGIIKLEADSAAYLISARFGIAAPCEFPATSAWAGTDPRARPGMTIGVAGSRITAAASTLSAHLAGTPPPGPVPAGVSAGTKDKQASRMQHGRRAAAARPGAQPRPAAARPSSPPADLSPVLAEAERFYLTQAPRSWMPEYARSRGLDAAAIRDWRIGYAPAGWTNLTDHLRRLGHSDQDIQAAGLARLSSRGTLIDHFRDRAMLAIRDQHGTIAGYIGRARPGTGTDIPKYLNSPQTAAYTKGTILLGIYHGRDALARGAIPVLAEGPFDAIAITSCDPGRYAGLAACGTALTQQQLADLNRACPIADRGVIIATDGDRAGRQAAVRAYHLISALTTRSGLVTFPDGQDPADIFQASGAAALARTLRENLSPLARLVIDMEIEQRPGTTGSAHETLTVMRAAAHLIAELLGAQSRHDIMAITQGRELRTLTDDLRPVSDPAVTKIADLLTTAAACQVAAAADRLGFDYSDIITEVANAVTLQAQSPKRLVGRDHSHDHPRDQPRPLRPPDLAAISFPHLPEPATAGSPTSTSPAAKKARPYSAPMRHAASRLESWKPTASPRGPRPGCGLRIEEALAVQKSCFRDGGAVLRVFEQASDNGRKTGPPKHRKAGEYRDIPVPGTLAGDGEGPAGRLPVHEKREAALLQRLLRRVH